MVPSCVGEGAGEEDDPEVVGEGEVPEGGISSTVLVVALLLAVWDNF